MGVLSLSLPLSNIWNSAGKMTFPYRKEQLVNRWSTKRQLEDVNSLTGILSSCANRAKSACPFIGFPGGSENPPADARGTGDLGSILGRGGALEKEMATHSSVLAWEIPWTEEPGGLQSMGSQKSQT